MIYAAIILILIYLLVLIIVGHKEEGIGWIIGGMLFVLVTLIISIT